MPWYNSLGFRPERAGPCSRSGAPLPSPLPPRRVSGLMRTIQQTPDLADTKPGVLRRN